MMRISFTRSSTAYSARLAVDVVAEKDAAVAAGRPREDAANELASQEMAEFSHRQRGILEAVVIAVHEQHDLPCGAR